ncbi:MAG TPA: alanine racemase [Desulfatiglandales bacterium]|nr:alanine racemase [Desulfatiglandales bacterium]
MAAKGASTGALSTVDLRGGHLTKVFINLDNLTHNMALLQELAGLCPLWPAIKANAYGHDAEIIAGHLITMGYTTLGVAHVSEAIELIEKGLRALYVVFSPSLPENSEYFVRYEVEPVVCTLDQMRGLAEAARKAKKHLAVHLKVDTGMGRVGIRPDEVSGFLKRCRDLPEVSVRGIMSHFPGADEQDKSFSRKQIDIFEQVRIASREYGIESYHLANSAAIFDLPEASFDAARPGISIYGLKPSNMILNPRVNELKPVLEWKTRIIFQKEVPAGTGLSYGHMFHTDKPSLIATIPLGYGDGLSRLFSNKVEFLVGGVRCRQVGRICMDQCLVDVTALGGRAKLGDEVVIIGRQGNEEITADELAERLGTINYEIVTNIARRVPRIPLGKL